MKTFKKLDITRWQVIHTGTLTSSGCDEVIASFVFRHEAEVFVSDRKLPRDEFRVEKVYRNEL